MKNLKKVLFLFIVVSAFSIAKSQAQVVVSVRPERPKEYVAVRPAAPSSHHVWVAEEWTPEGGRYAYHAGYWAVPPHGHAAWIAGHWRDHRGGYVWVPGHWD
jgi:WXXGXW repeat (2 copies)